MDGHRPKTRGRALRVHHGIRQRGCAALVAAGPDRGGAPNLLIVLVHGHGPPYRDRAFICHAVARPWLRGARLIHNGRPSGPPYRRQRDLHHRHRHRCQAHQVPRAIFDLEGHRGRPAARARRQGACRLVCAVPLWERCDTRIIDRPGKRVAGGRVHTRRQRELGSHARDDPIRAQRHRHRHHVDRHRRRKRT